MRLCKPVSLCLAAAAALIPASAPVPAYAEAGPSCAGPDTGDFPLTTRLHGGPASYRAGGGFGTWYLDLTNTTDRACDGVHPVVVLVDAQRALQPPQPQLEFYADGQPHPVRFETTDEDELVGTLTDSDQSTGSGEPQVSVTPFLGFTVPPGRTVTVKLRLALTSDAVPNQVTANAAVVQRQGEDGEWIGQSNDYRFTVESETRPTTPEPKASAPDPAADSDSASPSAAASAPASASATASASASTSAPASDSASTSASAPTSDSDSDSASDSDSDSDSAPPTGLPALALQAEELARTGLTSPVGAVATAVCLLAAGIALVLARRRR
ncbi:hypothetical protein ABZ614_15310 [Streptomyces sp. NPDC013178]|uniref:hypothetical protein n=1 Tax=Streptomyces sp. NPDC013178 TaxID=3155118 RepID=UPI0033EAE421